MTVNQKEKGARGERMWRDVLRDYGYDARRGQQYCGSPESPDVICDDLPFHFEVKFTERLRMYDAIDQARDDADKDKIPVVAHKKNNYDWLVIMRGDDFMKIVKEIG